jgi:hypothetical protein
MNRSISGVHNGVRFQVEAILRGDVFEGRFTLLDGGAVPGTDDSFRPTTDNAWATEAEALSYATEAAHHAIEGIPPFVGRGREDGRAAPGAPGFQADR